MGNWKSRDKKLSKRKQIKNQNRVGKVTKESSRDAFKNHK